MNTYPAPTTEDLLEITSEVWSSYLDVEGDQPLLPLVTPGEARGVCASVSLTGAWRGHVVVVCSANASREAAAALMGIDTDSVSDEDVADALGELANVIGGNLKSLLPEPSALSLPHVVSGEHVFWPAVSEVCRVDATWRNEPVNISLLESKE
jgi:chemotaxis protein CheX